MSKAAGSTSQNVAYSSSKLRSLDVCAGGGGLALGLEQAGFHPVLLVEQLTEACNTLRRNRPGWKVIQADLHDFDPDEHRTTWDVDLLSAGLPRVQASAAVSRTRGSDIELDLLKVTTWLVHGVQPRALLIENVANIVTKDTYRPIRTFIREELDNLGYESKWFIVNAADFGVPQDRKLGILVAFKGHELARFQLPQPITSDQRITVGEALCESMKSRGWLGADRWATRANEVAPTLVGGSMDRGGADLGPTGTKRAWARMGVNASSLADDVPAADFHWDPDVGREGMVKLTVPQTAILQGFPTEWQFEGRKTRRYRQIGHATPPPVAKALGQAIRLALDTP
ncbi:DNA cytosine methyltransferase [Nocardia transvalensis]|uniref:DNA cytosine methyltransferase n=1 Tax=Nocardia transvalensis TaxID=37333 RepID=UPI001894B3D1|nr:DNA (cytosine-5-)-methyltransferase [Nocardia transvalensis]MBF6329228.1 DNA (cytosine-5-)-methyltransferase [Nocardia transvalensis]